MYLLHRTRDRVRPRPGWDMGSRMSHRGGSAMQPAQIFKIELFRQSRRQSLLCEVNVGGFCRYYAKVMLKTWAHRAALGLKGLGPCRSLGLRTHARCSPSSLGRLSLGSPLTRRWPPGSRFPLDFKAPPCLPRAAHALHSAREASDEQAKGVLMIGAQDG